MMKKGVLAILMVLAIAVGGFLFTTTENNPRNSGDITNPLSPTREPSIAEPSPTPTQSPVTESPKKQLPEVAIVVDDLGNSANINKSISEISIPLTLAILPFRQYTSNAVDYFDNDNQKELILHMPMEPIGEKDQEEKMLMTDMDKSEINALINESFDEVNNSVVGMNNHKGSLFTSNKEKMKIIMNELKKRNLYFLDSYTYAESIGFSLAKEMGLKTVQRDVFIDGQSDKKYIKKKLYETVRIAERNGQAVAIGHARSNTIEVLIEEVPNLTNRVNFVKASKLTE